MASADTTSSRTTKQPAKSTAAAAKRATTTKRTTTPAAAAAKATAKSSVAERAVLIPVGAALIARDKVVSGVNDTISSYSSTSKTQAQLRKFERRGNTARKRIEREVRKARVPASSASCASAVRTVPELADRLQEHIQSLV